MLTESFVAMMALITACVIDQHLYFGMNAPLGLTGGTPESAAAYTNGLGLVGPGGQPLHDATPEVFSQAAAGVGEQTIISRTGGAPTLAFGMAQIFGEIPLIGAAKAFWYHFAVMFEALFILTTIDASTRVARSMISDLLANVPGLGRFADHQWRPGAWITTALTVLGWGALVVMGVTDPLGETNMLYPLFGIANQLLAAIALAVVMAIVAKRGPSFVKWLWIIAAPLAFAAVVTITASAYKIFSPNPAIGYWANHFRYRDALAANDTSLGTPEVMGAVIRNTFVQGTLSIVFVVLAIIVIAASIAVTIAAIRRGGDTHEDEPTPSRRFAPAGFIATPSERALEKEWEPILANERAANRH